jgi:hypothetical protein
MFFSTYFDPELSRRFTEDMVIRNLTAKTQIDYVRALNRLCEYLKHSPENATRDNLREFQLFLVQDGATGTTINCILKDDLVKCYMSLKSIKVVAREYVTKMSFYPPKAA